MEASPPGRGAPAATGLPSVPGVVDLEPIGRGGFGVVYRGHQPDLGREVAVKVISSPGTPEASLQRWRREVTAMGRLSNHPNIVAVFAGGVTDDGSPYLVMPYVPGGSLRDRLAESGPLPAREVATLGVKLAGALATAHAAGVLHRDVKPDNVLMSPYGEPQLTDFGIARLLDTTTTATGTVHATIPYAPPEVLAGQPATEAADIYGLGATLYACLAGAPPFPTGKEDTLVALVGRIATQPAPDLRERGVPDALASVIDRALAKTPQQRIATAYELRRRLTEVRDLLPAGDRGARGQAATAPMTAPVPVPLPPPIAEEDERTMAVPVLPEATPPGLRPVEPPPTTVSSPAAVSSLTAVSSLAAVSSPTGPPLAGPASARRGPPDRDGSPRWLLAALAVLLALLLAGLVAYLVARGGPSDKTVSSSSTTSTTGPSSTVAPASAPSTAAPTEPPTTESTTESTTEPTTATTEPGATTGPPPGDDSTAMQNAALRYFQDLQAGDTRAAYGLLTPEFQARQSYSCFAAFWDPRSVQITGQPTASGQDVTVPVQLAGRQQTFTLSMAKRKGNWLVSGPRPRSAC
ncbi:MAG: serine/threonine protein kinase [Actinobacteria bacterium]|nr:serine/threonine protein kinase [Actinomycetota bacterium]